MPLFLLFIFLFADILYIELFQLFREAFVEYIARVFLYLLQRGNTCYGNFSKYIFYSDTE